MAAKQAIDTLIAEMARTREILARIESFYLDRFGKGTAAECERNVDRAIILSEILCNYYTCLETFCLRVSQLFENNLDASAWHRDLLNKMVLNIEGERKAVLSEPAYLAAGEMMRFRHFKRYYFQFDYDWDRLDLVAKKYEELTRLLPQDFGQFEKFLHEMREELTGA